MTRPLGIVAVLVLAAAMADAANIRSLEGTEQESVVQARTAVAGTVTGVDRRTGAVTVRVAGAEMTVAVPPASAARLRPGTPVTVDVVLVVQPPAPGTPGGGPAPADTGAPAREVHRPAGDVHRVRPDMVSPPPER